MLLTGIAFGLAIGGPLALAAPGDPFWSALPGRDAKRPEGVKFSAGAGAVSEQMGSASYSFPLELPAGRNGMSPSLELRYSSTGALRGGVAVGFGLDLPSIERDPSFLTQERYRSGADRLVLVNAADPAGGAGYRAEVDPTFTHYLRSADGTWRTLSPSGRVREFYEVGAARWLLSRERDQFGNTVTYSYEPVEQGGFVDRLPKVIEYTSNAAAGLGPHARVEFVYEPLESCGGTPKGAAVDYHFGLRRWSGSRRLAEIRVSVKDFAGSATTAVLAGSQPGQLGWRRARTYTLSYDLAELACTGPALRYLTQIDVAAYTVDGIESKAPPVRFSYGPRTRELIRTLSVASAPVETGDMLGPKTGFLDMDGDGRLDFVEIKTEAKCRMVWRKGLANGQFEAAQPPIDLPTAQWKNGATPSGAFEYCRLNGQNVPGQNACMRPLLPSVSYQFIDFDSDGRVDLLTSVSRPPSSLSRVTLGEGTVSCSNSDPGGGFIDTFNCVRTDTLSQDPTAPPPAPPPTGGCTTLPTPERDPVNGADYVWHVQRNLGGRFAPYLDATGQDAWSLTAPVALPSGVGEAQLASPVQGTPPGLPALIDMTGDGYLDTVKLAAVGPKTLTVCTSDPKPVCTQAVNVSPGNVTALLVRPGNGRQFGPEQTWQFTVPPGDVRPWAQQLEVASKVDVAGGVHLTTPSTLALRDVNGDGLPDFLVQASGVISVAYNQAGARSQGLLPGGSFSQIVSMGLSSPVEETRTELPTWWESQPTLVTGVRAFLRRLLDVDADGYPELVLLTPSGSVSGASSQRLAMRIVGGGSFIDWPASMGEAWEATEGLVSAESGTWTRRSDLLDLTGDGLPDAVTWSGNGNATIRTDGVSVPVAMGSVVVPAGPLRLLGSIDNGRGGVTRFEYARSSDPAVVTVVPAARAMEPTWVVSRVVTNPGAGQPEMSTRYRYALPVFGHDSPQALGPKVFQGFTSVSAESSGQQGEASQRVDKTFSYARLDADMGGRLESELISLRSGSAWAPLRHVEHRYISAALFGAGASGPSATLRSAMLERTCVPGATSCALQTSSLSETTETWTPWSPTPGGPAVLMLDTQTRESLRDDSSPRFTTRQYQVRYMQAPHGSSDYRVLVTQEERGRVYSLQTVAGATTKLLPWARTVTSYSAAGLPEETRVYKDATSFVTTRRSFDAQTGNLTSVTSPNQVAANQALAESYSYDIHRLRVSATSNQNGNTVTDSFDVATGALLRRVGPSFRLVDPPGGCAWFCWNPVYQVEAWTIDGFGRMLQHHDSRDPAPGVQGYDLRLIETVRYFDREVPSRRERSKLRGPGSWVIDEERHDGLGRVITSVARRQLAGQCDAVTSYSYDAGGELRQIATPNPASDCQSVATLYSRDGAGRVTAVAHPDGSSELLTYTALDTEVLEHAGLEGPGARTTLRKNARGELLEVREHDNPEPGQTALTRYTYDPLGRMALLADADGNLTSIGYDWRSLRTAVTRGGRVWSYEYDANGNMTAQREPLPAGGLPENYVSTTTYDVVNRPVTHTPAHREMTAPARRAQLGIGPVTTSYNWMDAVDRPQQISLPFGTISFGYGATGQVTREQRSLTLNQGATVASNQWVARGYDDLGHPTQVKWDDGTEWRYAYDHRGAVADVFWRNPSSGQEVLLAHYDRRVAGQPYRRTSSYASQQRDWQYDVLGRVTYDRIFHPTSGQTYHERVFGHDGHGELRDVSGATSGLSAQTSLAYDARHRVKQAEGPMAYRADLTYSGAGNVRTATIAGASDVVNRNVLYAYGAADAHAVDRLTDRLSGATVASFSYDRAGNMVQRSAGPSTHTLAWDGDGMLREASGPTGVERYFFGPTAERMASIGPEGVKVWFAESESLYSTAGTLLRRYHHIAAGEPLARVENRTAVELQYADALQNLVLSLSQSNTVMAAFVYGAFGEVVASQDGSSHRRRFNGKEHDAVSGLRHYGYRSYDPLTLRWVSADPQFRFVPDLAWTEPQRANLYAFSLNNPVQYVDPDGRNPVVLIILKEFFSAGVTTFETLDTIDDAKGVTEDFIEGYQTGDVSPSTVDTVIDWEGATLEVGAKSLGRAVRVAHRNAELQRCSRPSVNCETKQQRAKRAEASKRDAAEKNQRMRAQLRAATVLRIKKLQDMLDHIVEAGYSAGEARSKETDPDDRAKLDAEIDQIEKEEAAVREQIRQAEQTIK